MDDISLIGNEKGTTAVEMAIIFMLLLIIIFGIIEFGLLIFNKQILTDASREGARVGVVLGRDRPCAKPPPQLLSEFEYVYASRQTAYDYCADHLINFGPDTLDFNDVIDIYVDYDDTNGNGCPDRGENLIVKLKYDYELLLLSAFRIYEDPINLEAVTIMKFE